MFQSREITSRFDGDFLEALTPKLDGKHTHSTENIPMILQNGLTGQIEDLP